MATSKVSLKLLVDTKSNKVLFAEAGKDFVDFLFNFLALPVGTVIKLLTKESMVGCVGNLYESIEELGENYVQPNQTKDSLLEPQLPFFAAEVPLLLSNNDSFITRKFYLCSRDYGCKQGRRRMMCQREVDCNGSYGVADDPHALCPQCNSSMSKEVPFVAGPLVQKASASVEGGFVKGVVTYMVMDDLVVKPMSTISSIALLNKFNIKEVGALEEKVVDLGMTEGLSLLKASLQTRSVLTDVFLGNLGKE